MSIHRSPISVESNRVKRHKSTAFQKSKDSIRSSQSSICHSNKALASRNGLPVSSNTTKGKQPTTNQIEKTGTRIQNNNIKNGSPSGKNSCLSRTSTISMKSNTTPKSPIPNERIPNKLKLISNILANTGSPTNLPTHGQNDEIPPKIEFPNPAESLKKVKEILQFLDVRIQQNELSAENRMFSLENLNLVERQENHFIQNYEPYKDSSDAQIQFTRLDDAPKFADAGCDASGNTDRSDTKQLKGNNLSHNGEIQSKHDTEGVNPGDAITSKIRTNVVADEVFYYFQI